MKNFLLWSLVLLCPGPARSAEDLQTIVVKPGDTLWSISNTYLKDPKKWNEILKYNHLRSSDPSIALPGMPLKVPVDLIKEQYRAAKLVYFLNEVFFRRTGVSDWQNVSARMDLFKNDALRTKAEARADVRFYTGETLNLYQNTVAVLRPPGKRKVDVEMLAGELHSVRSRVLTRSAAITPKTRDAEFGTRIGEDLTTVVKVTRGLVDVEAHGSKVEVPAGFGTEVKMDMPPSRPVKLALLPRFESEGGSVYAPRPFAPVKITAPAAPPPAPAPAGNETDRSTDPDAIVKLLSVGMPVQGYHLQISRDRRFDAPLFDKVYDAVEDIDLSESLPPGDYFMRVALIDLLGFEGKFSQPRRVRVKSGR